MSNDSLRSVATVDQDLAQRPVASSAPEMTPLRTHDVWVLPVEVLLEVFKAEHRVLELPKAAEAALVADEGELWILTAPGLEDEVRTYGIRQLLTQYIARPRDCMTLTPRSDANAPGGIRAVAGQASADPPAGIPAPVVDLGTFCPDSQWAPLHGWRSDEEVITALRALITDALGGMAEDIPDEAYPLPEGVGAAITFGYDKEGEGHALVWVRKDLPSGLRADLWGFCVALAGFPDRIDSAADEDGICYIGIEGTWVPGPGTALLAALTVQRMGRRPGNCAFPFLRPSAMPEEVIPLAA